MFEGYVFGKSRKNMKLKIQHSQPKGTKRVRKPSCCWVLESQQEENVNIIEFDIQNEPKRRCHEQTGDKVKASAALLVFITNVE